MTNRTSPRRGRTTIPSTDDRASGGGERLGDGESYDERNDRVERPVVARFVVGWVIFKKCLHLLIH